MPNHHYDQEQRHAPDKEAPTDACKPEAARLPESKPRTELLSLADQIEALTVPGYAVQTKGIFTIVTRTRKKAKNDTYVAHIGEYVQSSDARSAFATKILTDFLFPGIQVAYARQQMGSFAVALH